MALTDTTIRNSKPSEKPYKLFDGGGLYIEIKPSGGKLWRLKYRFAKREKLLSLGVYPTLTLADARGRREQAKKLLSDGFDPGVLKQQEKARKNLLAANSFECVAREWFESYLVTKSIRYKEKVVRLLERDVFPYVGSRPIAELSAPEILTVVRRVESRGLRETAHRVQQNIGQVIRYAIREGKAQIDPTVAIRGALLPVQSKHMAAPSEDPEKVAEILRMVDAFNGGMVVFCALSIPSKT